MKQAKKKQLIWLLLMILWMAVIFYYSHQPAAESSEISGSICYKIVSAINKICSQNWSDAQLAQRAEGLSYPVRKAAHMSEYAILAVLILQVLNASTRRARYWMYYVIAQLLASLYAMTDEFHQLYIPGRSGAWSDVGIDSIGACLGLMLVFLVIRKVKEKQNEINKGPD